MDVRVHVWIEGRVQGVSFRAYTQKEAQQLGLAGWVRNTDDGRVEAVFEGDEAKVRAMVAWCDRGSPLSRVSRVTAAQEGVCGEVGFVIRH